RILVPQPFVLRRTNGEPDVSRPVHALSRLEQGEYVGYRVSAGEDEDTIREPFGQPAQVVLQQNAFGCDGLPKGALHAAPPLRKTSWVGSAQRLGGELLRLVDRKKSSPEIGEFVRLQDPPRLPHLRAP